MDGFALGAQWITLEILLLNQSVEYALNRKEMLSYKKRIFPLLDFYLLYLAYPMGGTGMAFPESTITYACPVGEILFHLVIFWNMIFSILCYNNNCSVMISCIRLGLFMPGQYN